MSSWISEPVLWRNTRVFRGERLTARFSGAYGERRRSRSGASTLDYVLLLAIIMPLLAFLLGIAPKLMSVVYEMTSVLVSWPFLWMR